MQAKTGQRVPRRNVLGGLLGTMIAAGPLRRAYALSDGPPPFETARHQFTILSPARQMPAVQIARLNGGTVNIASFQGKVLLVNLWATWCPACRADLMSLDRLQETMGRAELQVIAISLDRGGRAVVAPFVRDLKLRHLDIYLDPDNRTVRGPDDNNPAIPFDAYGMPLSYVIDRAGRIAGYLAGDADWLSSDARNLLAYYAGGAG